MIAKRYAKALLGLAVKEGQTVPIRKDMDLIGRLLKSKRYFEFFTNRFITASAKMEVLAGLEPLTRDFLRLVITNKREGSLHLIAREYVNQMNKMNDIVEVEVSARAPLSLEHKKQIEAKMRSYLGKKILMDYRTDKSIIGGVRIGYEGKVIDGTVSGQLSALLGQMTKD